MNVRELREALVGLSDDMPVVLQKDAEGNGYSPSAGAELGWYEAETTWYGETVHSDDYTPEDYPDAVLSLILWPVN